MRRLSDVLCVTQTAHCLSSAPHRLSCPAVIFWIVIASELRYNEIQKQILSREKPL